MNIFNMDGSIYHYTIYHIFHLSHFSYYYCMSGTWSIRLMARHHDKSHVEYPKKTNEGFFSPFCENR